MAKKRAFASQEREFQVQRAGRIMRASLMFSATLLSFAALGLMVADHLYRPDTFVISQLKIKGQFRYLDPATIKAALPEKDLGNFFSVELDKIKEKIEELAWVHKADVRREWPNTLEIMVVEQRPVMRWGDDQWVSSVGTVIALPDVTELENAIVLQGNEQDAPRMLQTVFLWKKQLDQSGLQIRSARLSGSQAWTLTLYYPDHNAQFDLVLGRDDVAERLQRFQNLFDKRFKFTQQKLQRVDARYPDGLAIRATSHKPDDAIAANNTLAR